jgi:hypothetical protein
MRFPQYKIIKKLYKKSIKLNKLKSIKLNN